MYFFKGNLLSLRNAHIAIWSYALVINLGCKSEPNASQLKRIFISDSIENDVVATPTFMADFIQDSVSYNYEPDFHQAYTKIQPLLLALDTSDMAPETKQYAKALLLAEWIYKSFSFQFLGAYIGKADTSKYSLDFNQGDIKYLYNKANSNYTPVWCGDRTTFFIRLLDSILNLKSYPVSIPGIHTFPVVKIGKKDYIIDPTDPFIIFNEENSKILDYKSIHTATNPYLILRTNHIFGEPGKLVSNLFLRFLLTQCHSAHQKFSEKVTSYFVKNTEILIKQVDSCTIEPFMIPYEYRPVNSPTNSYIVYTKRKYIPSQISIDRFKKIYCGIDCKLSVQ